LGAAIASDSQCSGGFGTLIASDDSYHSEKMDNNNIGNANVFWKNDADLWLKRNDISTKIHHIRREADMKT
jgi:hypothetical protein